LNNGINDVVGITGGDTNKMFLKIALYTSQVEHQLMVVEIDHHHQEEHPPVSDTSVSKNAGKILIWIITKKFTNFTKSD
jgi:hypothetical protein